MRQNGAPRCWWALQPQDCQSCGVTDYPVVTLGPHSPGDAPRSFTNPLPNENSLDALPVLSTDRDGRGSVHRDARVPEAVSAGTVVRVALRGVINLARLIGAVAIGWLGYNRFQDPTFAVEFSWLTYGLILGGFALFVSCGLSLLSFLWFLVRFAIYWERVISMAGRYEEVSQFRRELVTRRLLAEPAEHRLRRPISAG